MTEFRKSKVLGENLKQELSERKEKCYVLGWNGRPKPQDQNITFQEEQNRS